MTSTVKRLAAVAAVGTMGILAPVASASAATPPATAGFALPNLTVPNYPIPSLPAFDPAALGSAGWGRGLSSVIGPTVITVGAGNIFTNTTLTTAAGGAVVSSPW